MKKKYISPIVTIDCISSENTFATTSMYWQMKACNAPSESMVSMKDTKSLKSLLKHNMKGLKVDFTKYKK